jgi:phage/plasmid-like protein (TIGR03299 family)
MAHEIERNKATGNHEFAYRGEKAWHGLGQSIESDNTVEQIATKAGFDFEIMSANVTYLANDEQHHDFAAKRVLYRSDDQTPLGVVSDSYQITQPIETLQFFADWSNANGAVIETAGLIRHGHRYFATAKLADIEEQSIAGDTIAYYVLLASSADGSLANTGIVTGTRVVCNNTLQIALNRGKQRAAYQKHNSAFDPDRMKLDMELVRDATEQQACAMRQLADVTIDESHVDALAAMIMGEGPVSKKTGEQKQGRVASKVVDLYNGVGLIGADTLPANSAYRFLNSVTQYVDHSSGRTPDAIWQSSNFGKGAAQKAEAMTLMQRYADHDEDLFAQLLARPKSISVTVPSSFSADGGFAALLNQPMQRI